MRAGLAGRGGRCLEFAAGDDVEACSLPSEKPEDGERGVGFDGVTDGVRAVAEGGFEELEAVGDLLGGVDVEGGGVVDGECCEIDSVAVKGVIAVGEWTGGKIGCGRMLSRSFRRGLRQGSMNFQTPVACKERCTGLLPG